MGGRIRKFCFPSSAVQNAHTDDVVIALFDFRSCAAERFGKIIQVEKELNMNNMVDST